MGDGATIHKQAASNALAGWHDAATELDGSFRAQAPNTQAALDNGSWIGNDDAGNAFRKQFDVQQVNDFLDPTKTYSPKGNGSGAGAITDGIIHLGTNAKKAIENSLTADEQQRQEMQKAHKKADAANSNGSSPSAAASTSTGSGTSPSAGTSPTSALTAGVANASGTVTAAQTENATIPFNGPLQWGIEGADGTWHPLQPDTDLSSKEFQTPQQWGIESPDGTWHPLPDNADPKDFQGPMQWGIESPDGTWHPLQPDTDLSSKEFQGALQWGVQGADGTWHALPDDASSPLQVSQMPATFTSQVVGQNGHLTGTDNQQWHGMAAETAEMLNTAHPTNPAMTNTAVTSGEVPPGQPTPMVSSEHGFETLSASGHPAPVAPTTADPIQQGVHNAAATAPAQPDPFEDAEPPED